MDISQARTIGLGVVMEEACGIEGGQVNENFVVVVFSLRILQNSSMPHINTVYTPNNVYSSMQLGWLHRQSKK